MENIGASNTPVERLIGSNPILGTKISYNYINNKIVRCAELVLHWAVSC